MKKKMDSLNKTIAIGIIFLLLGIGIIPTIYGQNNNKDGISLTFYIFDKTGIKKCNVELTIDIVENISEMFDKLTNRIINDPLGAKTESMKNNFIDTLDMHGLIPKSLSKEHIASLLSPKWNKRMIDISSFSKSSINLMQSSAFGSAFFCSIAGGGSGILLPPIMLPRPRLATIWTAYQDAISIASNIYTGHGFAAGGSQLGTALGFWGIGLSFAFPGEPAIFGFGGYALAIFVFAEDIETYPPNQAPIISNEQPADSSVNVPTTLSELSFHISDADSDRMDYTVTTNPYIGAGSGNNVVGGTYTIPVSGLENDNYYIWTVKVTDGKNTIEKSFSFYTIKEKPIIFDINPKDGAENIDINLSELTFSLSDYQGDKMDYTVETSPNIGSGDGNQVENGTYSVHISNMDFYTNYAWFVNVTDGLHLTKEIFTFTTRPKGMIIFNPTDDATIRERDPDSPTGDGKSINVRNHGGGDWTYQGLIKFDISSIPSDTDITSAKLYCYYYTYKDNNPSGNTFNIYRITSDWDEETVTWNTQPTCASQPTSFIIMPQSPGEWLEWDVKSDVEDFVEGTKDNFGWKISDDTYWQWADIPITRLCSKEYGSNIPYLEIVLDE